MKLNFKVFAALFLSAFSVCIILIHPSLIYAEEASQQQLGEFKDEETSYYYLDAVPDDFGEDKSLWENTKNKFWFLDMKDNFGKKMNELFNFLINTAFELNLLMTRMMISTLDIAYDFEFVDSIINKLSEIMAPISGITANGKISESGLFGNFAKFVAILAVIYAVYMLLWKRSMFSSLSTILQTIFALTIAVLLFTNYSSFLTGLNQVTTEASQLIISGNQSQVETSNPTETSPIATNSPTGLNEENLKQKMRDNLWSMFVDRPYLYMMYGVTSLEEINKNGNEQQAIQRVKNILKKKPKTESRYEEIIIEKDVNKNQFVTYSNVSKRLSFTPMYLSINGITSIPIYILALTLILFQFWFMIIALFAPFALLVGAVPGQFNIIKRYFIELGLPMVLKILVSFAALVIFALSELLYQTDFAINNNNGNAFFSYITVAIIHFVLFMLIFLLRKRISNIFSAGSKGIHELRDGMGTVTNPLKKGVQGVSTASGAAIGAMATGGVGAMSGANIGSSVGKVATGEGSIGEVARNGIQAQRSLQLASLKKQNGNSAFPNQVNQLTDDGANNLSNFMNEEMTEKYTKEKTDDVIDVFDKEGITNVSLNELKTVHANLVKDMEKEGTLKDDYSIAMAKGVKELQRNNELSNQAENLGKVERLRSIPTANEWVEDTPNMYANQTAHYQKPAGKTSLAPIPEANNWIDDTPHMYSTVPIEETREPSERESDNNNLYKRTTEKNMPKMYDNDYADLISMEENMPLPPDQFDNQPNDYGSLKKRGE